MKRIVSLFLAACMFCILFTACGGAGSSNYNIADVASAVEAVAVVQNPTEFTDDDLIYDMSIDLEQVEEYTGHRTLTNGMSGAVLVIKAKSGQAEAMKAQLEAYRDGIVATWENYKDDFPIGYEQTKNGRVVVKGDYLVLAIAGEGVDYADVDAAIEKAFE